MRFFSFIIFLIIITSGSPFNINSEKETGIQVKLPKRTRRLFWPSYFFKTTPTKPPREDEECGIGPGSPLYAQPVTGGREAAPLSWPWIGTLYRIEDGELALACGCSLISPIHVITAAHCVVYSKNNETVIPAEEFKVRFGAHSLRSNQGVYFNVERIHLHPDFNYIYNDIAILTLSSKVTDVLKNQAILVCLPTVSMMNETFEGEEGTVIGWGRQVTGGHNSDVLLQVHIPIISTKECSQRFSKIRMYSSRFPAGLPENFLCAIAPGGGRDACEGDSGSPIMVQRNFKWFVIGVVSFGVNCGSPNYPGVYSRITSHMQWIQSIIKKRS